MSNPAPVATTAANPQEGERRVPIPPNQQPSLYVGGELILILNVLLKPQLRGKTKKHACVFVCRERENGTLSSVSPYFSIACTSFFLLI